MIVYKEWQVKKKGPYFDVGRNNRQPAGLSVLRDPLAERILFHGGARSGKTDLIVAWMVARALFWPNYSQIILRKNRNQCEKRIFDETLRVLLDKFVPKRYYTLNRDKLTVTFYNGSRIVCDGCDDKERVRNIFGSEWLTMFFNEASEFPLDVVDDLTSRNVQHVERAGVEAACKIILDTNPKGKAHWIYKQCIQGVNPTTGEPIPKGQRWSVVGGWHITDNLKNIAKNSLQKLESMQSEIARRQLIDGEWCSGEGLVYNEFNERQHVRPQGYAFVDGKPRGRVYRSIDFGFNEPFCCLFATIVDDVVIIFDMIYRKKTLLEDHVERILDMCKGWDVAWTVADSASPEYIGQLKRMGFRAKPSKKDPRKVEGASGFELVKRRLRDGRLIITRNCRPLLAEIETYEFETGTDSPADGDDHAMDALRYLITQIDWRGRSSMITATG